MVRTSKDGRTIIGDSWIELGINADERMNQQKTLCPNCSHSRSNKNDKCLSINNGDGVGNCHNCGITYVIERGRGDIATVPIKKEYKLPNQKIEYDINENVEKWFLEERHISLSTLKKAKVTSGSKFMPQVGKEMATINFNYFFNGELVNVKYRDGKKNFVMESGARLVFYNMNCLLDNELNEITIVEGEIDALSFIESGVSNVISVPNGASKGSMNLDYLTENYDLFDSAWRIKNGLKPLSKITIATDNDDPGEALKQELIRRLGAYRCYEVNFNGRKDCNEVLVNDGKVAVFNLVSLAKAVPIKDITEASSLLDEIMKIKRDGGLSPGNQVGSEKFKTLYSYEPSRLTVITGIPSHGKSEYVDDQMVRLALKHDWVFAIFSPENFPIELHVTKLMSKMNGKHFNHMTEQEIRSSLEIINSHFIWIYPEDDNYRLRNILNITEEIVKRYGANSLVIDPWTEIDKEGSHDTEDVNDYLSMINQFKRKLNLHIFLVAHPTKMPRVEGGKHEVPDLYSISGSANFFNKADGGLTVYRDFISDTVEIYVNKVKFKHLGKIGHCVLKYNVNNGRYQDVESLNRNGWDNGNWLQEESHQLALKI
jgi:twinkle protein